jgi:hypothetical protein
MPKFFEVSAKLRDYALEFVAFLLDKQAGGADLFTASS